MKRNPREANQIDEHVGSRVRLRRQLLKMSQEKLGEELGVTFQQVQKYERGSNRIGASRLWSLSHVLDVPVTFFFDGLSAAKGGLAESDQSPIVYDFIQSPDGVALAQAFSRISDSKVRRRILDLVRTLADENAVDSE
ncbi:MULTISPECIES: helix-turn-helix domain-containing protein [Hyphobacterium]|uniref:Helix-turn-helix domain-containing protein n=1 Tax=Hyphobacterium vulgare TaxID=1736751 RepID=A0ABV6ZXF7_9PROT